MKIKLLSVIQAVLLLVTLTFSKNLRKETISEDEYYS